MAIRPDNGFFCTYKCSRFSYVHLVLAELNAATEGVKLPDYLGIQKVVLEMDILDAVKKLKTPRLIIHVFSFFPKF